MPVGKILWVHAYMYTSDTEAIRLIGEGLRASSAPLEELMLRWNTQKDISTRSDSALVHIPQINLHI